MLTEKHQVEFTAFPPYSFELTVHKPAGWWWSAPNEIYENGTLWTTARLSAHLHGLRLKATGNPRKPKVECGIFSDKKLSEQEKDGVTRTVERAIGVKEDIREFYAMATKDKILKQTVEDLCGMRTVAWPELFPALILAVTLQMAPMKRSNQMMDLIITNFGDEVCFDGKTIMHWPSPKKIASLEIDELKKRAKLGYRAQNLIAIAKTLQNRFPNRRRTLRHAAQRSQKTTYDAARNRRLLLRDCHAWNGFSPRRLERKNLQPHLRRKTTRFAPRRNPRAQAESGRTLGAMAGTRFRVRFE